MKVPKRSKKSILQCTLRALGSRSNKWVEVGEAQVYQPGMLQKAFFMAAWIAVAVIVCATLSPIALRPEIAAPNLERFGAYAILGFLFGMAYPRKIALVLEIVIGAAVLLEVLQLFTSDRHGTLLDVLFKTAGDLTGVIASVVASLIASRVAASLR